MTSTEVLSVSRTKRLERLRAQLQGSAVKGAEARVQPSRGTRLLYGVMLHGAARFHAGLELTDLEAGLVGPLCRLFSQEEVADFGRVYQEEAASRSRLFPDSLAARPVTEGYTVTDLVRDLPLLHAEIAAQPNVAVIDLDAPTAATGKSEGGTLDSEEFMRGVDAYGWGATVVTASGHRAGAQSVQPMQVALKLDRFYVHEETDEWSGSDEYYWVTAASADGASAPQRYTSPKFGDVDEDEKHYFPANTSLFTGSVSKVVICHIQCWEQDEGAPSGLQETMARIAEEIHYVADELGKYAVGTELETVSHFVSMLGGIAHFISEVVAYHEDDLVGERTFLFDRAALEAMAAKPGQEYVYGFSTGSYVDGRRDLAIKGEAVITHTNTIALITYGASGWSSPTLPWPGSKTPDSPAMVMNKGILYCAVRGMNNKVYVSQYEGGRWTAFIPVPGVSTTHAPALGTWAGSLYLAYTGLDGGEYVVLSEGPDVWGSPYAIPIGVSAATGPGLAFHDERLWLAYATSANQIRVCSSSIVWWPPQDVGHTSASPPALASFGGKLHMAYRGTDNGIYITTRNPDPDANRAWPAAQRLPGSTPDSPALAVRGNTLYCAVRGGGNRIHLASNTGSAWSSFETIPTDVSSLSGPALGAPDANQLHVVFRSSDL